MLCALGFALAGCRDRAGESSSETAKAAPPSASPDVETEQLESVISIDIDRDSTCALLDNGRVACWGLDDSRGWCEGVPWLCDPSARPVLLPGDVSLVALTGFYGNWRGLAEDGSLYVWGESLTPLGVRTGLGDSADRNIMPADPKFEPFDELARREPRWVFSVGGRQHSFRPLPYGINNIKAFNGGCVVDTQNQTLCPATVDERNGWWGPLPPSWQHQPTFGRGITCSAVGRELRCDYYEPDAPFQGQPTASAVASLPAAAAGHVSVGAEFMCVRLEDHRVACATVRDYSQPSWTKGELPVQAEVKYPGVTRHIVVGGDDICAIMESGTVQCWDTPGLLPAERTTVRVNDPHKIPGLSDTSHLAAGANHWCAVTAGSKTWCWGDDDKGQLGNGDPFERSDQPVPVLGAVEPSTK